MRARSGDGVFGTVIGLFGAALLAAASAQAQDERAAEQGRAVAEHPTIQRMLEENNRLRASVGLPAQQLDPALCLAAQRHAQHMAETGHFAHFCCDGGPGDRARRAGWTGGGCAENIACGQRGVRAAFAAWRSSSGHWANMCSRHRKCGFGLAYRNGVPYWVAMYAD